MSDAAAAATQPRSGGAAKGGNRACFKCGKTGHWSKDCTAPREEWIPQQPRAEAGVPQSPTDVGAAEGEDGAPAKPAPAAKKRSNRKPKFTVRPPPSFRRLDPPSRKRLFRDPRRGSRVAPAPAPAPGRALTAESAPSLRPPTGGRTPPRSQRRVVRVRPDPREVRRDRQGTRARARRFRASRRALPRVDPQDVPPHHARGGDEEGPNALQDARGARHRARVQGEGAPRGGGRSRGRPAARL